MIVGFAIRFSVSLEEVFGSELLLAVGAYEMLGMPCFAKGGDHLRQEFKRLPCKEEIRSTTYLTNNGLIASATTTFLSSSDSLFLHTYSEGL